jgi:endo-1,4-beta-D-glucanase Y
MAHRYLVMAPCLLFLACSSSATSPTGTAGTNGAGGTTGAGGTSGPIPGLGTGGPFTFPQNKVSGSCTLTTVANASTLAMSAYTTWRSTYVVPGTDATGKAAGMRVERPENGEDTVSEGIGYGMLAAVYANDRNTFDGLWTYARAHFDTFTNTLMNWHITSAGATASDGTGSATDGDEDMAWALLMASDQWNSTTYLTAAQNMINAMYGFSVFPDGSLQNGDHWQDTNAMNTDYFSPAYYRVFAKATNNPAWAGLVIDKNYTHLAAVTGTDGLVPDESNLQDSLVQNPTTCPSCKPNYGYDACRMPWRIAMDYCFNNEPRAKTYLTAVGAFFNGVGAANIGDGYTSPNGPVTSNNHNSAFIGPAGVAGMTGYPTLLDGAFNFGVTPPNPSSNNSYFAQSLKVVTMLMMSGNFLDYTQLQ